MYFAHLEPFTGYDEIISAEDFRTIYNLVLSEARAAGNNLPSWRVVWIMKENEDGSGSDYVCGVFNWADGTIDIARPENLPNKSWRITVSDRRSYPDNSKTIVLADRRPL